MWVSEAIRTAAVHGAVLSQRTLFPYHFVHGSAQLNALGQSDLRVLAENLAASGGELGVRRGSCPDALYQARLRAVTEQLVALGVPRKELRVVDGPPGGEGAPSTRVLRILDEERPQVAGPTSTAENEGARIQ